MNHQGSNCKIYNGNCNLAATKLLRKRSLQNQKHPNLSQATLEKSHAASNLIDKSVQDLSDFDKKSEDFSNPEFVFTSHQLKSLEAVLKSPQNPK